jgi:hypothetical protein
MIVLGIGKTSTKISHTETSNVAGFSAVGADNSVSSTEFSFSVIKEFMHQNRFSFSGILKGGINDGSGSGTENSIAFKEEYSGNHFGAGLSANLNYLYSNMKVQPYVGVGIIQETSIYEMNYTTSGSQGVKTSYNYTGMILDTNLGIRVLDPEVGLMSFFNISFLSPSSETIDAKVLVSSTEGTLNPGKLEKSSILFSLGFGFIF